MMRPPKSANKVLLVIVLAVLALGILIFYRRQNNQPKPLPPTEITYETPQEKPINHTSNTTLPNSLLVKVPFTAQAPTANWDELHNEACEEASSIMVNAYFNNVTSLPPATVEEQIASLTRWQDDHYGYHLSIDTTETARMIEDFYGLKTEMVQISETAIKQALADNKLVIWPGNGRLLNNPNFRAPGPIYHMLVITGWNARGMITNDPGTRNGQNYQYTYQTLYDAAGNYLHDQKETDPTDKRIIIVSKE